MIATSMMQLVLSLAICVMTTVALENGLARTPPMGWRSWNLFGDKVSQELIITMMNALVIRNREVDGMFMSNILTEQFI